MVSLTYVQYHTVLTIKQFLDSAGCACQYFFLLARQMANINKLTDIIFPVFFVVRSYVEG